jgi:hypothetical protein
VSIADKFSFLKLPPTLDDESRHFIGTIIISELQHAIMSRKDTSRTFCLYVDEFQHFATDEFAKFITEGRKYGCAISLAHQERVGQFGANEKILGATMACANKVIFQCTVKDARELAPEFAQKPTATETRKIPELVICKEPMWDLLRRGHDNPRIMELFRNRLRVNIFEAMENEKDEAEDLRMAHSGHFGEALLYRDQASLSGIDEKRENIFASQARGRDITVSHASLDRTEALLQQAMHQHDLARDVHNLMRATLWVIQGMRKRLHRMEYLLVALMEGRLPLTTGQELYAELIYAVAAGECPPETYDYRGIYKLYIYLTYGDNSLVRTIPAEFALKHWPKLAEEAYIKFCEPFQRKGLSLKEWDEKKKKLIKSVYDGGRWSTDEDDAYSRENRVWFTTYRQKVTAIIQNIQEVRDKCLREFKADDLKRIEDAIEFCNLLAKPENHIKVPSGVYREVAVNVATTQEMVNRAVQELTELPRFTAMAKILLEENGKQSVKKATIKLQPPPKRRQAAAFAIEIADFANGTIGRNRDEIAKQIVERAAPFEEGKRGKQQQQKSSPKKGHSDPPDQPESPPQGWVC